MSSEVTTLSTLKSIARDSIEVRAAVVDTESVYSRAIHHSSFLLWMELRKRKHSPNSRGDGNYLLPAL